jgi:hypothetical protein
VLPVGSTTRSFPRRVAGSFLKGSSSATGRWGTTIFAVFKHLVNLERKSATSNKGRRTKKGNHFFKSFKREKSLEKRE